MTIAGDLTYHLPYSESPADEFQSPSGEWFCTLRAITFDSWLLWRHALPEDLYLWRELSHDVYTTIEALARRIHVMHQTFPDYKRLCDTPFVVSRWWDPTDDSGEWAYGDRVLLKIKGYTARDVAQEMPSRLKEQLIMQPRSTNWIEFSLPGGHPHCSEAA